MVCKHKAMRQEDWLMPEIMPNTPRQMFTILDPYCAKTLYHQILIGLYFSSLERSAKLQTCGLCRAIYRMVQYADEAEDAEFFFIDEDIGLNHGDSPPFLLIDFLQMDLYFQIRNPEVISRSTFRHSNQEATAPTDVREHVDHALEAECSDASTGSDASMAQMKSWIKICENDHQICGEKVSKSFSTYPKRLLDVSQAATGLVFLVLSEESNLHITRSRYATLSHRWKPGHSCSTNSSTERKYAQDGIAVNTLTKTFRDAVITTQKLGLRYLWIDSLCIIQDLDDDKVHEIPKMADYYQNADFNIAESTEQTDAGLFYDRDGQANRPLRLPVTINTPDLPITTRKVILELSPILRAPASHLDSRGWILQERIFPRRTFFFDPYWVSFECAEMSASESCPRGVKKNIGTSSSQLEMDMATIVSRDASLSTMGGILRTQYKSTFEGHQLSDAERTQVLHMWFTVLTEYCSRNLTFESDRLNAISALATRLSQILQDEYVSGVWRRNLLESLWWSVSNAPHHHLPVRFKNSGVPTWSWASLAYTDKAPRNVRRPFDFFEAPSVKPHVQVRDISSAPRAKITLSGGLLRGYMYLTGNEDDYTELVTVTEGLRSRPKYQQNRHLYDGTAEWRMHICATSSGQRDRVTLQVFPDESDITEGFVYLLPLAEATGSGAWEEGRMPPTIEDGLLFGLVLKENPDGTFRRVGSVQTRADLLMATNARRVVLV
ncbi:hypothetical protein FPOAC1_007155 [Fusarium poae]|uniref:hypothetical protein n=1 Tax=Fusarium poae TaxID=36050 RepID=UPI001CE9D136|nr:hypothetical protein FPOAC1_007155 [Fusarium poae]KAG8673836.1 hypothetical protein FPOAC1_007155 [Fusarium poae]